MFVVPLIEKERLGDGSIGLAMPTKWPEMCTRNHPTIRPSLGLVEILLRNLLSTTLVERLGLRVSAIP